MSSRFSTVLIGEGTLLVQCAEVLLARGHAIDHVVSTDPGIAGWADGHKIAHSAFGPDLAEMLGGHSFDYLFSIANLELIPEAVLALPKRMAINFHDGPLPRYAGLYATTWALLNQENMHGVTWHEMTATADAGRIVVQQLFPISRGETALTLNAKCYEAGIEAFKSVVDGLGAGTLTLDQQDASARTYFARRQRPAAACTIDWTEPAAHIAALIRALTFGPYANPLGTAKLWLGDGAIAVREASETELTVDALPGTVVEIGPESMTIAAGDTSGVVITKLTTLQGTALSIADACNRHGLRRGSRLEPLPSETIERLSTLHKQTCTSESFWAERLSTLQPASLPTGSASDVNVASQPVTAPMEYPRGLQDLAKAKNIDPRQIVLAGVVGYLARVSDAETVDLAFETADLQRSITGLDSYFAGDVPLRLSVNGSASGASLIDVTGDELARLQKHRTYPQDIFGRYPQLVGKADASGSASMPIRIVWNDQDHVSESSLASPARLVLGPTAETCRWMFDAKSYDPDTVRQLAARFATFLAALVENPAEQVVKLPLVTPQERQQLVVEWNDTARPYERRQTLHELFEAQVARTPDAVAVTCRDQSLTYRQLNQRANHLARHLRGLGVGADQLVGVFMTRSIDMMVALLGTLKAGGAYVPLDPQYPRERIAVMVEDAAATVILTEKSVASKLPPSDATVVSIDVDWPQISQGSSENPAALGSSDDLAYVIFTSGSTGRPKGVMVRHRNVVNYFVGMDESLGRDRSGVWLAVTSISFDISVQELFWPLTHGFTVVIYTGEDRAAAPRATTPQPVQRPLDFSLFYFAADEGPNPHDRYRLLLEGAKFADSHGFSAVWTPERHFHAFGGLYPNPSVVSAALATITNRVQLRAGSVVMPLHSPIRVAEEWSLVDNLSHGRVGISFASGWQSNDFVLRPENYAKRKQIMFRDLDIVRRLWRGEAVSFPGGDGAAVDVRILPRPIQSELPVWVTAAGTPDTFRTAGEIGANVLTHLLGQNLKELADKIRIYRDAWREHGHKGQGSVALMLHTFVGDDTDAVREIVRKPFSDYLRTSVDLIKNAPAAFPTHKPPEGAMAQHLEKGMQQVTAEDMEALLDFAFERYFESSGLFGSVDRCLEIVNDVRALGADEIACLVDFGVHPSIVLASLRQLAVVRERSQAVTVPQADDLTIAALIARHKVTHLQCTPSMAQMLVADSDSREALSSLQTLLVGGEALPAALAEALTGVVRGDIHNMYGPTETTIWSTTSRVDARRGPVTIGRPLANQEVLVLDRYQQLVPPGLSGEICIGGDGVVRGYFRRDDLTAERFVQHPFREDPSERVYRTGDLGRLQSDGTIEFIGRIDHQVKIRGYRVELGDIETTLAQHPSVRETVVVAREDVPGDKRLVAYVVPPNGRAPDVAELHTFLHDKLPDFMVPSAFVVLNKLPLTPNGKTDRRALPAPDRARQTAASSAVESPRTETERLIASLFEEALNLNAVGAHDNFFDLGAHSLLMVQVHSKLQETLGRRLSLIHLFRFPTVSTLAAHLNEDEPAQATLDQSAARADRRRESLARRQQMRRQSVH